MKLSKREKWSWALCLSAIVCFAVCVYMKCSEVPGVRWPFIVGAILAIVALGISEREWPFTWSFHDELLHPAFRAVQARIPKIPAWVRDKDAWASVRKHQADAQLSTKPASVLVVADQPIGSQLPVSGAAVATVARPAVVEVVHRPQ